MALLDEQLVEEWLNRNGYFTMRGIKVGVDEIDLLALKYIDGVADYKHVEVQVSYKPIGYIGGDTNAKKRTTDEIKAGVAQWVEKKFTSNKKIEKRNAIAPNANWEYTLVHGVLRDETELKYMRELGVNTVPYKQVLSFLQTDKTNQSSSAASNIVEMLKFMQD
jgi:hypothetical protein